MLYKGKRFLMFLATAGLAIVAVMQAEAKSGPGKEVATMKQWRGRIDPALHKEAPACGYIGSEKALTKLWLAWKIKEPMPKVNFDKLLFLVVTAKTDNVIIVPQLNDKGDLHVGQVMTSAAFLRHEFSFVIAQVSRDGIKTIEGKPIDKD